MRVKYFILAFLIFSFFPQAPVVEAATMRLNVPKVELELAPGETYSGEIICENPTEQELGLKIYLEDWVYEDKNGEGSGEKIFSPVGSTPLSAGKWITFSPAEDTLKPFGRTILRYTISVPTDGSLKGGYYSVLFFEAIIGSAKDEEGVNILVAGRIGTLFMIHVKGTVERKGRIEAIDIKPPLENSPLEIWTQFRNTGNVDITLEGNFLVMDEQGKIFARGDLKKVYTQPGGSGRRKTEWIGRLNPGVYTVLLTYDMGKGQTDVREETISIE